MLRFLAIHLLKKYRTLANLSKELAVTNSRVDGLEARINEFEAGSFSETTTASFSTDFYLGSVDGGTTGTNLPIQAT